MPREKKREPSSRVAIARLCGLAVTRSPTQEWRLDSVVSDGAGRIRLTVINGGDPRTIFLRKGPTDSYFLRAGDFDISYEGKEADKSFTNLLESLGARLKEKKPQDLLDLMYEDPEAVTEGKSGDGADPDSQGISDRLGGNPGQWRRFFCDREFARHSFWQGSSGFAGKVLYFVHADYDCSFMPPDITFRGMTFLNYPPVHPHSEETPLMDTQYEHWTSELQDKDVVVGTDHKLENLMEEIKTRVKPDLIMIQWSCVPTIIGDDKDKLAAQCKEAGDCPVLTNTIQKRLEEGGNYSPFEELFDQLREDKRFTDVKRDPDAVNLVDCPPYFYNDELGAILEEAGIKVNFRIFPTVDLTRVREYLAAHCQILPDYFRDVPTVQRSLGELDLKTYYTPPPFGICGTQEYVRTVSRPFGKERETKAMDRLAQNLNAIRSKWEALSEEAKKNKVAFVADEDSLPALRRPEFLTGIPVVQLVNEMGFETEILFYAPGGKLPKAVKDMKVTPFSDQESLKRALEEGKFRAVYSDIFFDKRITSAGKNQFSMRTFEAGLNGALRSLERMVGLCRHDFYARYRKNIARNHV